MASMTKKKPRLLEDVSLAGLCKATVAARTHCPISESTGGCCGNAISEPLFQFDTCLLLSSVVFPSLALVVAMDHMKIAECCREFGAEVIMTSESCKNGTERCYEALQWLGKRYDIVINIQGDEPLIEPDIVDGVVRVLQNIRGASTSPMLPMPTISTVSIRFLCFTKTQQDRDTLPVYNVNGSYDGENNIFNLMLFLSDSFSKP